MNETEIEAQIEDLEERLEASDNTKDKIYQQTIDYETILEARDG